MAGLGKKKMQRRERQAEKRAAKNDGNQSPPSSSRRNVTTLPADEWFAKFTDEVLDKPGIPMDGIMRNMIRMTAEIRTREYGALTSLLGKNLVWLQLVLIDETRSIQGKLHGIGAKVLPKDLHVAERSSSLFRETAPYLLRDTKRWIFSRSLVFTGYTGLIDEALTFHSYDPLGGLMELPVDMPLAARCTEVFIFVAGDFAVEEGGLDSREAVEKLLHGLNTAEGSRKIHGFDVVAGSGKVSPEKLVVLKDTHHLSA